MEEGIKIINQCLSSLQERFVMSQASFTVKAITKDGIKVIREAEKPQGYWFVCGIDSNKNSLSCIHSSFIKYYFIGQLFLPRVCQIQMPRLK